MPPFRKVGNVIKEKFDGATEVELRKVGTTKVLVPRNSQFKPHTDEDLVYLDPSPDFCEHDPRTPGILGTAGRFCNKTSKAIDGCELMCCGRGFHTEEVEVVDRCSCKFHWCCYVKCKQCRKMVEMHTCRWSRLQNLSVTTSLHAQGNQTNSQAFHETIEEHVIHETLKYRGEYTRGPNWEYFSLFSFCL